MKQAEAWGYSYGILRHLDATALPIPMPVALGALDAVLVVQADVKPDGRIERSALMQAEPRQLAVEELAVFGCRQIAVFDAPVGDRARHPVDQLANAPLPLRRVHLAVEILAHDDIRRQLGPGRGDFAVSSAQTATRRFRP